MVKPARINAIPPPTMEERGAGLAAVHGSGCRGGKLPSPVTSWRVFERGGKRKLEVGNPDPDEDPGKPTGPVAPWSGYLEPHGSRFPGLAENPPVGPDSLYVGDQRSSR